MKKVIFTQSIVSPLGMLQIGEYLGEICFIQFYQDKNLDRNLARFSRQLNAEFVEQLTPLLQQATQQLQAYFLGQRQYFDLPLYLYGTTFQKAVWQTLRQIPYGETCCYQDIARNIGCPLAVRAVGGANNANLLPIIIPCHRVIQKNGELGGYDGGVEIKAFLLALEKKYK